MSKTHAQKGRDKSVKERVYAELAVIGIQRGSQSETDLFGGCRQIINGIVEDYKQRPWEGTVLRMSILCFCAMYIFPLPGDAEIDLDDGLEAE